MNRIFLSYAHKDASEVAEWLYRRLTGCGYEVWKDNHSLPLGSSFPREISNAVGQQDYFIVLLSAAAVASAWVQDEIDMAKVARRQLIPVILAEAALPYLKDAGAGIVPHGHPALACSILAHLLGTTNQMPLLFYTYRLENGKFGVSNDRFLSLQNIRDQGFEYRKRYF